MVLDNGNELTLIQTSDVSSKINLILKCSSLGLLAVDEITLNAENGISRSASRFCCRFNTCTHMLWNEQKYDNKEISLYEINKY